MGTCKPKFIKTLARKLLEEHRDLFTDDFEHNKLALQRVVYIPSKNVRNRVAGYITRLVKLEMRRRGQIRGEAF